MIKNIFVISVLLTLIGCGDDNKSKTTPKDTNPQEESTSTSSLSAELLKNFTGEDDIIIYSAFSNAKTALIRGRAQEKKELSEATQDDGFFSNLGKSLSLVGNNEIKNEKIFAIIDGKKYETTTNDEGYFTFTIELKTTLPMGYKEIDIQLQDNPNKHTLNLTVVAEELDEKIVGIISDVDDTVLISNVTSKLDLIDNSLFTNYKQREVVPTMKNRFDLILNSNSKTVPSTLFFVSGSPRKFIIPIESFLEYNNFPQHNTFLKEIEVSNTLEQTSYKTSAITSIIELYPNMEWVLFGDSGEMDEEIYKAIQKKFPNQVKEFYIRDVETGKINKK